MKIGLFGGTFDPIHLGHLAIATAAHQELRLDKVHFIPCRQSPHKSEGTQASTEQRCEMIRLAIEDHSWAELCNIELDRPSPSYSWQTVAWFRATQPQSQLHWILGADQWMNLHLWSRADYLQLALTFVVFPRDEHPILPRPSFQMLELGVTHPASSTSVREKGDFDHLSPEVKDYMIQERIYR